MKERKKRSAIWKIEKNKMMEIVKRSNTFKEVLGYFGLINKGGNSKTLKSRMIRDNIDFSHITTGYAHNKGKRFPSKAKPIEKYLIENSPYHRGHLKKRLIKEGLIENKCLLCGLMPEWNGKRLVMVLDHINGVSNDNRLDNLRLLCPNCNSQQPTFAGHSLKKTYNCNVCGSNIGKLSKVCRKCFGKQNRKVIRPTKEQLEKDILEAPMITVGKKYGVSDNSIRKWAKYYGIKIVSNVEFQSVVSIPLCEDFKSGKMNIDELSKKYKTSTYMVRKILLNNRLIEKNVKKQYKHGSPGIYFDSTRRDYICYITIDKKDKFLKRGFKTSQEAIEYRKLFLDPSFKNGQKVTE